MHIFEFNENQINDKQKGMLVGKINKLLDGYKVSKECKELYDYNKPVITSNFAKLKQDNIIFFKKNAKEGGLCNKVISISKEGVFYEFIVDYGNSIVRLVYEKDLEKI